MANVWMTYDQINENFPFYGVDTFGDIWSAQYLNTNGEYVDCPSAEKSGAYDRSVNDVTCDMYWWNGGGISGTSRYVCRYDLYCARFANDQPDLAARRLRIRFPIYMRNVKYLDIAFLIWTDLGFARGASLAAYNGVSGVAYSKNGQMLKLNCIPSNDNAHPGTARLTEGVYGPGFVPFHFFYDDSENPIDIDFIEIESSGAYTERHPTLQYDIFSFWVVQPCYNDDAEFVDDPQPIPQEINQGPVTPSRAGGQGTFTSISNNDGDRSGTSLLSAISTANTTFKTVLGDAFNIYEVGASDLSKVINVLYGSEYFTRFENTMFNPLSAIISCALLPEIFVSSPAPLHDMLAGGYNISDHIWPTPVTFKSPEPLIVRHIGDISLNKYFDGYADFDPYTKAKLHLPYIGEIAIDINKIAHGELAVDYVCDVLSGNVAAWVWCNDIDGNHQYCYTATGNCAYNIPLFSATADGSAIGKIIGGVASISVGNILGGAMSVADGAAGVVSRHTQVTGTYSGNIGQVTNPKCFLEISRPQWVNVDEPNVDEPYRTGVGLPEIMKGTIESNNLIGHLSVSWVDLTNIASTAGNLEFPVTPEELSEIESLLKSGILIKE